MAGNPDDIVSRMVDKLSSETTLPRHGIELRQAEVIDSDSDAHTADISYLGSSTTTADAQVLGGLGLPASNEYVWVLKPEFAPPLVLTKIGASANPKTRVRRSANQSVATATWDAMSWDAQDWELGGDTWTSGLPTLLFADRPGIWQITTTIEFDNDNTGWRGIRTIKNGTGTDRDMILMPCTASTLPFRATGSDFWEMDESDYIEVEVYQSTGSNLDITGRAHWNYVP